MIASFGLAAVSLLDDLHNLPVGLRFIAHFVAASACLFALGLTGWGLVGATLGVVWMTNLYNFMDGADGLAGGMATIGFAAFAVVAGLSGGAKLAAFCAVISAASGAFLRFNFPPARLFMGDAGSIPLGFLAAVVGILGARSGIWPWIFPLLVFSPFIVDASVTLIRRVLKGEKVWRAHRSHYYQRAVLLGATHRQVAFAALGLMLLMTGLALMVWAYPRYAVPVLILSSIFYLFVFALVDRRWHRATRNEH
jgi:UDP-N-acetylmuramyl pentapeptide phosphotransferase/UDP-N-acetylglucosamine-1-phosphate transferase